LTLFPLVSYTPRVGEGCCCSPPAPLVCSGAIGVPETDRHGFRTTFCRARRTCVRPDQSRGERREYRARCALGSMWQHVLRVLRLELNRIVNHSLNIRTCVLRHVGLLHLHPFRNGRRRSSSSPPELPPVQIPEFHIRNSAYPQAFLRPVPAQDLARPTMLDEAALFRRGRRVRGGTGRQEV
jgi:hypothetical protein